MWKLAIEDDEGKRTVVALTRDQYTIGRKDGNTIRLTERNVSREHARILRKTQTTEGATETPATGNGKTTIVLEDLTSYNGVFVNGLRISHAQNLVHGDLVQIGDYRIVLQDETVADLPPATIPNDIKQTAPGAPNAHAALAQAQALAARTAAIADRPNRFIMVAGPTPGAEYVLDRERLTVGRAEDASISVNHNSVSRLHCEVHALGDGRFEIVDKGSSNGVRVNGADLRRGIVEPGDVIELGDVQFKFVGAGQIYRPTESQRLASVTDREAKALARGRRPSNALPIAIFATVVLAGSLGAWTYARRGDASHTSASAPSPERAALDDAKALCAAGDCEGAQKKIDAAIADSSPFRTTQEFKDFETKWADQLLAKADGEPDGAAKRAMYQRVAQTIAVDPSRRKTAADKLQALESVADAFPPAAAAAQPVSAPSASTKSHPDRAERAEESVAASPRSESTHRTTVPANYTPPEVSAAGAAPSPNAPPASSKPPSVDDRERALALQGTPDAKLQLKKQLEQRVFGGKASDTEIRLLIGTCKDLGDRVCVQAARAALAQKQE